MAGVGEVNGMVLPLLLRLRLERVSWFDSSSECSDPCQWAVDMVERRDSLSALSRRDIGSDD